MKTLPALFLLLFLSGCVSYYQPESALDDGVYYAEDDPSYVYNSADYTGVVYYPWASLDYFYFGYRSYPWYGFAYDYPYGYYGHYSPWYFSYYRNPYWRPYQKNCQNGRCREDGNHDRDAGDDRYAGDRQQNYGNRGDAGEEKASYSHDGKGKMGRAGYPPMQRPVAKTPAGVPGSQGRVVNNKEARKTGKSRVQPVYPRSAESITIQPSSAGTTSNPPTAPAINTSPSHDTRAPAFNAPDQMSSPGYGKSSKRKDRD